MRHFALLVFLALAACSDGHRYVMDEYSNMPIFRVPVDGAVWRVFDKPGQGKLMITPDFDVAVAEGFKRGAMFGLGKKRFREAGDFRPGAEAYLRPKGCSITGGRLLIDGQYEFTYTC